MDTKIDQETASNEFDRWAEAMDLDLETDEMDSEDLTAFKKQKNRIIKALMKGNLVINDNGEAEYTPSNPRSKHKEAIIFHERTGASLMAMDGKKKGHDVAKTYAVLAEMCKISPSVFAGLVGFDVKLCEAVFALLMD